MANSSTTGKGTFSKADHVPAEAVGFRHPNRPWYGSGDTGLLDAYSEQLPGTHPESGTVLVVDDHASPPVYRERSVRRAHSERRAGLPRPLEGGDDRAGRELHRTAVLTRIPVRAMPGPYERTMVAQPGDSESRTWPIIRVGHLRNRFHTKSVPGTRSHNARH